MRKLNKKQEQLLRLHVGAVFYDELPSAVIKELESLNWYESLHTDAERFLQDELSKRMWI